MVLQVTRLQGILTTQSRRGSKMCFAVNKMYNLVCKIFRKKNHRFTARREDWLRLSLKQAYYCPHISV